MSICFYDYTSPDVYFLFCFLCVLIHVLIQARLHVSSSLSCGVLLQASLSQFSVIPTEDTVGVWIMTAWSSMGPDRMGDLNNVSTSAIKGLFQQFTLVVRS